MPCPHDVDAQLQRLQHALTLVQADPERPRKTGRRPPAREPKGYEA